MYLRMPPLDQVLSLGSLCPCSHNRFCSSAGNLICFYVSPSVTDIHISTLRTVLTLSYFEMFLSLCCEFQFQYTFNVLHLTVTLSKTYVLLMLRPMRVMWAFSKMTRHCIECPIV